MKVLIFNENYYPNIKGGAEISTQLLAEELVKFNVDVVVCTLSDHRYVVERNGVKIYYLKFKNVYWEFNSNTPSALNKLIWHLIDTNNYMMGKSIKKIIEQERPDVIHTNNLCGFSTIVWKIAKDYRIPIVHTLRDYYLLCAKTTMFTNGVDCSTQCIKCKIFSQFSKRNSKYVDCLVGISNFILQRHLGYGYFENATLKTVILNPVRITCDSAIRRNVKAIGFLGTVSSHKGIEFLIESYLKSGRTDLSLEIGGTGEPDYLEYLKNKYPNPGIHFYGRVEARPFLSSIGMLIVPSLWNEPFGRVVAEAQSCGCNVATSNMGGLPELIQDKHLIFDIDNDEELTKIIRNYNELQGNRHHTSSDYSPWKIAQAYHNLYNDVLVSSKIEA